MIPLTVFSSISCSVLAVSSFRQMSDLSLSLSVCLILSRSLSRPSCSTNPGFPHSSISSAPHSRFHVLRHTKDKRRTHTLSLITQRHTLTHKHTHTHIHSSPGAPARTRGGEKRVEEFGLKSCSRLQTSGKVELMSFCLSVFSSSLLSVRLSVCRSVRPSV